MAFAAPRQTLPRSGLSANRDLARDSKIGGLRDDHVGNAGRADAKCSTAFRSCGQPFHDQFEIEKSPVVSDNMRTFTPN